MTVKVTDPRRLEMAFTKGAVIGQQLKEQIMQYRGEGNNYISDLTEQKLFSYMYSDASAEIK